MSTPDAGARRGHGRGQRRHHGGRALVVDAAREQQVELVERRPRPPASARPPRAAPPTGRSSTAGPVWPPHSKPSNTKRRAPSLRKRSSRPGRGHVQERADARRPPAWRPAAGRPPAISASGWAHVADHRQLLVAQVLGHEAEHAHAPGPVAQAGGGLLQQGPDLGLAPQQRQGQEGQAAALGHRLGEGGPVRHAGHGALDHRVGRAGGGGHARARGPGARPGGPRRRARRSRGAGRRPCAPTVP